MRTEVISLKRFYLALLLALACNSAMAHKWTEVFEDNNAIYYTDNSSITKRDGKVKMWSLIDFKTLQSAPKYKYLSLKFQAEFDCKGEQRRVLNSTYVSGNRGSGNVVFSSNEPTEWQPISPDSVSSFYWQLVCSK